MKPEQWHRLSLRRILLLVLLPGMLVVMGVQLWFAWQTATAAATAAYDRSLLGAIKSIDSSISTASGGLGVELPYRMLEFFELTASGAVYYKVSTEDGLVAIGNSDLPAPQKPLTTDIPQFDSTSYLDQPVRLGSYARVLEPPLPGTHPPNRVVIQVAESLSARNQFVQSFIRQMLVRDVSLIIASALLLVAGISWALQPLARVRTEVQTRSPQDLTPIENSAIPADVRPLIDAINHHVARNHQLIEGRRRFVDDASHQLRTPLTTLSTQLSFALREPDPARLNDALTALKVQLDEVIRQTNQMLTLARADTIQVVLEELDLSALAAELTRSWWSEASARQVDLGLDAPEQVVRVNANAGLLKEALSNLLHNAIRYTPRQGQVTVHVSSQPGWARIEVSDSGPGIPEAEIARAGERFFRASTATQSGSGLGLAITRSIAERHGGRLSLTHGPGGKGLSVTLSLPLAPDT